MLISESYWGQRYAQEITEEIFRFGFQDMELNRVEALCNITNLASKRVLDKLGMTLEGVLRDYIFEKGHFHTFYIYSLLKKEWENIKRP